MTKDKKKPIQSTQASTNSLGYSESLSGLVSELREAQEIIKKLDNEQTPTGVFKTFWNKWLSTSTS